MAVNITSVIEVNLEGTYSYQLDALEKKVDEDIERKNKEGYRVLSVTPLTGSSYSDTKHESYAQSFTYGILIVYESMAFTKQ